MARGPYSFKGYDQHGTHQTGQHNEPDLPAWVQARFNDGWTALEVTQIVEGDPMLCGAIYQRKVTAHPKSRTVRAWIADDALGWRKSGE